MQKEIDLKALKKRIRSGQPTKYNEDRHINLLAKIMNGTEGIAAFCDEAMISKKTFYNWLETSPSFREAYDILRMRSERIMEILLLKDTDIPQASLHIMYRNRHNSGRYKVVQPKDDTLTGWLDGLRNALQDGTLSVQEYVQMINALHTEMELRQGLRKSSVKKFSKVLKEELHAIIHSD